MSWREKSFDELPALAVRRESLRQALRTVTTAWMFGIVWMSLIVGSQWTTFQQLLGMGDFEFGLMSAINCGAALAQLGAAVIIERTGLRKYQFLYACAAHRMLWLVMAAVPLVIRPGPTAMIVFMFVLGTSAVLAQIATPTWLDWMSDLIPRRIRGRYFANRQALTMPIQIVVVLLAGLVLDHVTVRHLSGWEIAPAAAALPAALPSPTLPTPGLADAGAIRTSINMAVWSQPTFDAPMTFQFQPTLLYTLCAMFAVAAIFGTIDVLAFFRMREIISRPVVAEHDAPPARDRLRSFYHVISEPVNVLASAFRDRVSRHYALYWATLMFSITLADQYFWLNALNVLKFGSLATNAVFMVFGAMATWAMSRIWGKLIDRVGRRPILIICTIGVIFSPFGWFLMTPGATFWHNYLLAIGSCVLGGAMWAGVNLANNNVVLSFAEKSGRSKYMAAVMFVSALGGFAGGLVGGSVCRGLEHFKDHPIYVGPFPWNNYHIMFLLSAGIRGLSILWLIGMPDPGAAPVGTVVREIWGNLYSNIRIRSLWPGRGLVRLDSPTRSRRRKVPK